MSMGNCNGKPEGDTVGEKMDTERVFLTFKKIEKSYERI